MWSISTANNGILNNYLLFIPFKRSFFYLDFGMWCGSLHSNLCCSHSSRVDHLRLDSQHPSVPVRTTHAVSKIHCQGNTIPTGVEKRQQRAIAKRDALYRRLSRSDGKRVVNVAVGRLLGEKTDRINSHCFWGKVPINLELGIRTRIKQDVAHINKTTKQKRKIIFSEKRKVEQEGLSFVFQPMGTRVFVFRNWNES